MKLSCFSKKQKIIFITLHILKQYTFIEFFSILLYFFLVLYHVIFNLNKIIINGYFTYDIRLLIRFINNNK